MSERQTEVIQVLVKLLEGIDANLTCIATTVSTKVGEVQANIKEALLMLKAEPKHDDRMEAERHPGGWSIISRQQPEEEREQEQEHNQEGSAENFN